MISKPTVAFQKLRTENELKYVNYKGASPSAFQKYFAGAAVATILIIFRSLLVLPLREVTPNLIHLLQ